jgi:hypothetical protein
MKISTLGVITAVTRLLASCVNSLAIGGLQIAISGTNLVLSWPSYGYEHYLIQHRSTLDDTGSWSALTNNYPANSTERTAYTIYGVVPPPPEGGGGGGGGVPSPLGMSSMSMTAADANLILYLLDDATIAMLAKQHVFPPYEWDLQGREPFVWEQEGRPPYPWDPGATRSEALARSGILSLDGAESDGGETDSGGSGDGMGFYRVFHVPDWAFDVTNYTYDTTWFFPVDFADYMDRVENIHVLLNGEPTTYAEFTSHESGGQTNWGMLIDFDRLANGAYQIQLVTTLRLNEQVGDEAASLVLSNLPKSIVVLNQAAFPDGNDFIQGDTYTFKAQLANPTRIGRLTYTTRGVGSWALARDTRPTDRFRGPGICMMRWATNGTISTATPISSVKSRSVCRRAGGKQQRHSRFLSRAIPM